MNLLVIGGGGREHAICHKLIQDGAKTVYCSPGNPGIALSGGKNVVLDLSNHLAVINFVLENDIGLTVIGPEVPLADGLVNSFRGASLPIIGPTKAAAQLETSKVFARQLMHFSNIPQPSFIICIDQKQAIEAGNKFGFPVVVKIDGLAAGKGAFVCRDEAEFQEAIKAIFVEKKFGETSVLVEECLIGEEISVFAIVNGNRFKILGTAQDHKRLLDDDQGPNTGGMGAISPSPLADEVLMDKVINRIIHPILSAMIENDTPYTGFLYAGLMIVNGDPYVIEFNVRLGDPETQVILPRFKSSLLDLLNSSVDCGLVSGEVILEGAAATVVKVAQGYPGSYSKGNVVKGLGLDGQEVVFNEASETLSAEKGLVFHAGTTLQGEEILSSGGRVLNLVGISSNLPAAIAAAYKLTKCVGFDNEFYRRDIGQSALKH